MAKLFPEFYLPAGSTITKHYSNDTTEILFTYSPTLTVTQEINKKSQWLKSGTCVWNKHIQLICISKNKKILVDLFRSIDIHPPKLNHTTKIFMRHFSRPKQTCFASSEQLKAQLLLHLKIHPKKASNPQKHPHDTNEKALYTSVQDLRVTHSGSAEHCGRESFWMWNQIQSALTFHKHLCIHKDCIIP